MILLGPVVWLCSVVAAHWRARQQGYSRVLFTLLGCLMGFPGFLLTLLATRERLVPGRRLRQEVRTLSVLATCSSALCDSQVARVRTELETTWPHLVPDLDRAVRTQRLVLFCDSVVTSLDTDAAARTGSTTRVMSLCLGYIALKTLAVVTLSPKDGWSLSHLLVDPVATIVGVLVECAIAGILLVFLQSAAQYRLPGLGQVWMDIDFARFAASIDTAVASGVPCSKAYEAGLERASVLFRRVLQNGTLQMRLQQRLRWLLIGLSDHEDAAWAYQVFRDSAYRFTNASRVMWLWRWSVASCMVLPMVAFLVSVGPLHPG